MKIFGRFFQCLFEILAFAISAAAWKLLPRPKVKIRSIKLRVHRLLYEPIIALEYYQDKLEHRRLVYISTSC